ncbi:MAG: hypothetical protein FWE61_00885 [Micrococcales bacterium]|nr:hypothetical protein [Micrococcales bacterium]
MSISSALPTGPTAELREDLDGAFRLPVWGSKLGLGSSLRLNFGQAHMGDPRFGQWYGAWHLWIYFAAWRIETPGSVLGACEDSREEMERAIVSLDGKVLSECDVDIPSLSPTFHFSDGTRLRTFTHYNMEGGGEQWMLFRRDGMVRVVGPGYSWNLQRQQ